MNKRVHGRHGARWVALQGLYAWMISDEPLARIHEDLVSDDVFIDKQSMGMQAQEKPVKISFDKAYLHELFQAIGSRATELDDIIAPYLDRKTEELSTIEHAILLIATYELLERVEIPYKVVINEAIILAKQFGAQDSHKFVNGVLDKAAKVIREREFQAL